MENMPEEIPILPRRPGIPPSSDLTSAQPNWYTHRMSSYPGMYEGQAWCPYYPSPGFNFSYGRPLTDNRGSIFDGPRTISIALENALQMLYGWTQMIDGTYYTWTTSVSMAVSLWERISDLFSKCRKLLLAIVRWWIGIVYGKSYVSLKSVLESSWRTGMDSADRSKTFSILGVMLLISAVVFSIIKRKTLLEEHRDTEFVKLTTPVFAKVLHDFQPHNSGDISDLEKDQLVAITQVPESHVAWDSDRLRSSLDAQRLSEEPTWLYGRTKHGNYGVFPSNYVLIVDTQSSA